MNTPDRAYTMLDWALRYGNQGLHVFPLGEKAKEPLVGSHGHLGATRDPDQIRRAWGDNPNRNIGIACGASRLVVIDFDSPEAREQFMDSFPASDRGQVEAVFQSAPRVRTAKGEHLYFVAPAATEIRPRTRIADHVDVRAGGSYVVAPPSVHPSGQPYEWEEGRAPWDSPLQELPDALFQRLTDSTAKDHSTEGRPTIGEGERNDFLVSHAGVLWNRGLNEEATANTLMAINRSVCHPPLEESQVRKIAASAARNFERADTALGQAPNLVARSVNDILTNPLPPPSYLASQFLLEGQINLIAGLSFAGKSKIALDISVSLASGVQVLGHPYITVPRVRRVLYIYGEQGPTMWEERLRAILRNRSIDGDGVPLWLCDAASLRLNRPESVKEVSSLLKSLSAEVLVLDPVSVLSGIEDENDATQVVRCVREPIEQIMRATGVTPILIHHASKVHLFQEPHSAQELVRGSGDFWAMCGAIIAPWRDPKTGHVKVLTQGRLDNATPFRLVEAQVAKPESPLIYDGDWRGSSSAEQKARILRLIDEKGRVSRKDVETALDLKSSRAGDLLTQLAGSGEICKVGDGPSVAYARATGPSSADETGRAA